MTENRKYISLKTSIGNWLEDSGYGGSYDKPLLYKWADDVYKMVDESGDYLPFLCIIQVKDHKAKLPANFRKLFFAAGRRDLKNLECGHSKSTCDCDTKVKPKPCFKPTCKNEILEWNEQVFGTDCELKIQMNCNKCSKVDCDCISKDYILKVDQTMKATHPWLANNRSGYSYIGDFGRSKSSLGKPRKKKNSENPTFQKMKYSCNQAFNAEFILGECPNVNCKDCEMSFQVHDLDYIHTDFKDGEVLLAYEGARFDEDDPDFMMIPDIVELHNAIFYYIESKLLYQEWRKNRRNPKVNSRQDLADSQFLESKFEKELRLARTRLNQLNYHKFKGYLNDFIFRRVAFWHDDFFGKAAPKVTEEYLNYLHGRQ